MIATSPTTLPRRAADSATESLVALMEGTTAYWSAAVRRGATPFDVANDVVRWWEAMTERGEPTWSTPHEIVLDTPIARLRDFSDPDADIAVPTLILPPQAGHDSCIVDYSERQSQVRTLKAAGLTRLFSLDWKGATQETKDHSIDEYLALIDAAVARIGGERINLIGDCQGGWLATIWAALHPDRVHTLTIAGAPIDYRVGEPVIGDYVELLDPSFYHGIVAAGDGVLKGDLMLNGFVAIRPENEISKQIQLLAHIDEDAHRTRYRAFEDWFKHVQDIPGGFYLWIVEHLFRRNSLIKGELEIGGQIVDLGALDCPLYLLGGADDHITPPAQVFALAEHTNTPPGDVMRSVTEGGHLGLFMGSEALKEHWPVLMADVAKRSRGPADAKKAKQRTPRSPRPIPAP